MKIETLLKKYNKKCTPERLQLFAWMEKKHLFTSADLETNFNNIGRASIFRTLKLFREIWIIRKLNLWESWESYEVEHENHHHEHMKCNDCGDIMSFDSGNICKKLFSEAKKIGFQISEHSVWIFGTCKNCI